MNAKPYPVTAWSAVNGLGRTTAEVMAGLRRGEPALSAAPPGTPFATRCGRVDPDLPPLPEPLAAIDSRNNRFVQQALSELTHPLTAARDRWGPKRVGICVGSSTSAMDEIEAAHAAYSQVGAKDSTERSARSQGADVFERGSAEGLVQALRALTHFEGPVAVLSNACASSGKAFASAKRWLEADLVDAVLVGGADSLCQMTLRGFGSLGLLSEDATRPFCRERRGINIGEGAAFALLERRGTGPLLLGVGESADAHHMTRPDPEGEGARAAMAAALDDGGVSPQDVDYVNAHGTGTRFNDAMEARALRSALGSAADPLVVSTKGYIGHTLGAAGATEAVFVLQSLNEGWIPASAGANPLDPDLGLNVPTGLCETELRVALSNSFAFGGSNVSLLFGAPA